MYIILLGETCADRRVQGDSLRVNRTMYTGSASSVIHDSLYIKRLRPNTDLVPIRDHNLFYCNKITRQRLLSFKRTTLRIV